MTISSLPLWYVSLESVLYLLVGHPGRVRRITLRCDALRSEQHRSFKSSQSRRFCKIRHHSKSARSVQLLLMTVSF
jgi:hypothetical protein